ALRREVPGAVVLLLSLLGRPLPERRLGDWVTGGLGVGIRPSPMSPSPPCPPVRGLKGETTSGGARSQPPQKRHRSNGRVLQRQGGSPASRSPPSRRPSSSCRGSGSRGWG